MAKGRFFNLKIIFFSVMRGNLKTLLVCLPFASFFIGCSDPEDQNIGSGDKNIAIDKGGLTDRRNSSGGKSDQIQEFRKRLSNPEITKELRFKTLLELCDSSSIDDLEECWEMIEKNGILDNKEQFFKGRLLMSLSTTADLDQLLEFVVDNNGPGIDRETMISLVFSGKVLTIEEVMHFSDKLDFKSERDAVALGVGRIGRIEGSEKYLPILSSYLSSGQEALEKGAMSAISNIAWGGDYKKKIPMVFATLGGEPSDVRKKALNEFINSSPGINSLFVFEQLNDQFGKNGFEELDSKTRLYLVDQMSRENPQESVEQILSVEGEFPAELSRAFGKWFDRDVNVALSWYSNEKSGLTALQNDAFVGKIVEGALQKGEVDSAIEWVPQLRDQELVEQTLKKIADFKELEK